jgi:hypothetical protein
MISEKSSTLLTTLFDNALQALVNSMAGLGSGVDPQKKDLRPPRASSRDHPLTEPELHLPGLQIGDNHYQSPL